MHRTLDAPRAWAASKSPCRAMRFLSRQVIWSMDSIPLSASRWATAAGDMAIRELWESVRLNASTMSFRASAFLSKGPRSVPFGGFNSVVTRNLPDLEGLGKAAHSHLLTAMAEPPPL